MNYNTVKYSFSSYTTEFNEFHIIYEDFTLIFCERYISLLYFFRV